MNCHCHSLFTLLSDAPDFPSLYLSGIKIPESKHQPSCRPCPCLFCLFHLVFYLSIAAIYLVNNTSTQSRKPIASNCLTPAFATIRHSHKSAAFQVSAPPLDRISG
jgi:hypothetical protein